MLVFDFSANAGHPTRAFKNAGDTVIAFNIDADFNHNDTQTFMNLNAADLITRHGRPDFVWSSPPCKTFSVAALHHHWRGGFRAYVPATQAAIDNTKIVEQVKRLIKGLNPKLGFVIENPRGLLRKLDVLKEFHLQTITYCAYGDFRMKPTDLWFDVDGWLPRVPCTPGRSCHEAAPRGSRSGTNGLRTSAERAEIPIALGLEIREALLILEKEKQQEMEINHV